MSNDPSTYHMSSEAFAKHGHAMIDWIAKYMQEVRPTQ